MIYLCTRAGLPLSKFDSTRLNPCGSDDRIRLWDLQNSQLIRQLGEPMRAVWKVALRDEKTVIVAAQQEGVTLGVCIS
jgi:hypothetical protein